VAHVPSLIITYALSHSVHSDVLFNPFFTISPETTTFSVQSYSNCPPLSRLHTFVDTTHPAHELHHFFFPLFNTSFLGLLQPFPTFIGHSPFPFLPFAYLGKPGTIVPSPSLGLPSVARLIKKRDPIPLSIQVPLDVTFHDTFDAVFFSPTIPPTTCVPSVWEN